MTKNMASELINSVLLVIFAVFTGVNSISILKGPLHASCEVNWTFGNDCSVVKTKLMNQIEEWNGPKNCEKGGEKCLYKLKSVTDKKISATHETPQKHYVDSFSFELESCGDSKCCVHGVSSSDTWYAHLDYGTNFCNMKNLITENFLFDISRDRIFLRNVKQIQDDVSLWSRIG